MARVAAKLLVVAKGGRRVDPDYRCVAVEVAIVPDSEVGLRDAVLEGCEGAYGELLVSFFLSLFPFFFSFGSSLGFILRRRDILSTICIDGHAAADPVVDRSRDGARVRRGAA